VEPNIAAIDGGGVRGLVALVLLKRLQAALGGGDPIREYFDYFIGTSVGQMLSIKNCVDNY
jgi:calcium-independent phospholipase A2-gamma